MKNATNINTAAMGTLMGIAGIEHGLGEILQGNVTPPTFFIRSWPDAPCFRIVSGEPALTFIPNLLVSGILTVVFSLAYIIWANKFIQRKRGGAILALLACLMLLVGGGIFPPVFGMLMGWLGSRIGTPSPWFAKHLPARMHTQLANCWPWIFALCMLSWLSLFPGLSILSLLLPLKDSHLPIYLMIPAISTLILAIFTGFARDSHALGQKGAV